MATSKTIRVSWETYKKIMDLADARGIAVADAVDYLIENGQAQIEELRARLDYFNKLERDLKLYWDSHISFEWRGFDGLIDLLESIRGYVESLDQKIWDLEAQLKAYREMFPCSVCGKPMDWEPNDNMGQTIKAFIRDGRWGHRNCINSSKG